MEPAQLAVGVAAAMGIALVFGIVARIPYMLKDKSRFNNTDEWTPAYQPRKTPSATPLTPYERRIIEGYLESGETLEGFARAFFAPPRPKDYRFGSTLEKLPLLVAATSRRILLFEVTLLTIHRYCFISPDEIAYLHPPKAGFLGTSGKMKLGLKSGHEYQMSFFGPLFSDDGMREEQNMAAHFRRIAPNFASGSGSAERREAA